MLDQSDLVALIRLTELYPTQVITNTGTHKGSGPDEGKVFPYEYEYQEWALKGTVIDTLYGPLTSNIVFFAREPLTYHDGFHTYRLSTGRVYTVFLRQTNDIIRITQDSNQYIIPLADQYRVDWFEHQLNSKGKIASSTLVFTNMNMDMFKKWIIETKD